MEPQLFIFLPEQPLVQNRPVNICSIDSNSKPSLVLGKQLSKRQDNGRVPSMNLRVRETWVQTQVSNFLALWHWASYVTSISLSVKWAAYLPGPLRRWNARMYVGHLAVLSAEWCPSASSAVPGVILLWCTFTSGSVVTYTGRMTSASSKGTAHGHIEWVAPRVLVQSGKVRVLLWGPEGTTRYQHPF